MKTDVQSVEKRRIGEIIYYHIKKMILNKEIGVGERIPEKQIANYFNVSRTPIREALRNLEKYGLITIVPRRYAEVVRLQPDAKERLGILKLHIDSLAVELCVDNASDADCDKLELIARDCVRLAEARDMASLYERDSEFHLQLAACSENRFLLQIEQLLDVNVQLLRTTVYKNEQDISEGLQLHLPIVQAIRKRDKKTAVDLVQQHLLDFYFKKR
jgi:GntR family transcriptional regulator, rspAB operon transcriptional repressor